MNRSSLFSNFAGAYRALVLAGLLTGWGLADEPAKPAAEKPSAEKPATEKPAPKKTEKKKDEPRATYIRVRRDDAGQPLALETPIIRFKSKGAENPEVVVDLIGAVHIGDAAYYKQLNREFENYDVLLYELVAADGDVPRAGEKRRDAHPVSAVQRTMQSMLQLDFQLDRIDYTKANFVHADMSPEEFSESMRKRGESMWQILFRMMGRAAATQGNSKTSDVDLLFALFAKDRAFQLKRVMADQFEDLETQMDIFEGPDGSTLITERNKKAFEVLAKELKAGRKRIGVFYGAGHFADMEQRLGEQFGMVRREERWLPAWSLVKPAK